MKVKVLSACVLGLALGGLAQAADMPEVAEPYQKSFGAAWAKVVEGELPVYECTHVVGMAAKNVQEQATAEEARKAFRACYVESAVRYSDAFFKLHQNDTIGDDGKPIGCSMYNRYLNGHVGSMEVQAEKFGFAAADLNDEILQRVNETAASCKIRLGDWIKLGN